MTNSFVFNYNLRIMQEYFQHKIGRKIRIFSLGRKTTFLGKVRFFLGGGGGGLGPQRGGSSVKVSTKGGGPYPLFQLFKGRVTHLFQNF